MTVRGAIFDMDGTLLDSMGMWDSIGEAYLRFLGYEPEPDLADYLRDMTIREAAQYYQRRYGVTLSEEEIEDGVNAMLYRFYSEQVQPKPGAGELLALLKERGVPMCLATATPRPLAEPALERCGLLSYFEAVFTCDEEGHGKTEPFIFDRARSVLNTHRAQTAVFEDALYAVQTAKSAGFFVVGVRDEQEPRERKVRALSDIWLKSLSEPGPLLNVLPVFDGKKQT